MSDLVEIASAVRANTKMFSRELIAVHLCCNDPDNGNFAGRLYALEVGPNMEFGSKVWPPSACPRLRYIIEDGTTIGVAIAGKHFPITFIKNWYGNWCWDLVKMEGRYVLDLLNWPRLRRWFEIEEAEVRLFNWWKAGREWTDQDLRLIGKVFR